MTLSQSMEVGFSGKLLAKALQARNAASIIHLIHTPQGQPVVTSAEIATQFETYYSGFYNLPLDAEKASDTLAWDYLTAVLQRLGVQTCMLHFIMALYAAPSAKVWVNGLL